MPRNAGREEVNEILREASIVDVARSIGMRVDTRGVQARAVCPWHEDSKPSLHLYEQTSTNDRPHCHCFVCGAHGDAIDLVKQFLGVEFWEALERVASSTGRTLPGREFSKPKSSSKTLISRRHEGLSFAWKHFSKVGDKEKLAAWAKERGFAPEFLEKAEVCWVPGGSLLAAGNSWTREELDLLVEAGVLFRSYKPPKREGFHTGQLNLGDLYFELFHEDRILFAMRDVRGNITGIAGRAAEKAAERKYLYSRGFERSKTLYRCEIAAKAARSLKSSTKDARSPFHLFLVEGLMDALRLEYLGLHAVAILGSSLADDQVTALKGIQEPVKRKGKRLACHIFLDQDRAGKSGARRLIPKLLEWARDVESGVSIDIIHVLESAATGDSLEKDPDTLLRPIEQDGNTEALERIADWCYPILAFLRADYAGIPPLRKEEAWNDLPTATRADADFQIQQLLADFRDVPGLSDALLTAELRQRYTPSDDLKKLADRLINTDTKRRRRLIRDNVAPSEVARTYLLNALRLARGSTSNREFPRDEATWDRLEGGFHLFWRLMWDRLSARPGPHLPVRIPRLDGGEPRLKALPSPEALTLQMYHMLVLLQSDKMPAVVCERELGKERRLVTRGILLPESIRENGSAAVSFAYQVDGEALQGGGQSLFRHYADCWRDFNSYIFRRVQACRGKEFKGNLYAARLDIQRYYDSIPEYAVVDVLKPALKSIDPKEDFKSLLKVANLELEDTITAWVGKQLFNYEYRSEKNGTPLSYGKSSGIPQGPDLSAWVANIVLFSVDESLSNLVEEINTSYAARVPTESGTSNETIPVATYARYVDDIILVAPTLPDLNRLRGKLEIELQRLSLKLSAKTDPIDPRTPAQLEGWIRRHGGIHPTPSLAGYDGTEIESVAALSMRARLGGLTRKEALGILYSRSLFRSLPGSNGEVQTAELMASMQLIAEVVDNLRHNDWVKMAQHVWRIVALEGIAQPDLGICFIAKWNELPSTRPSLDVNPVNSDDTAQSRLTSAVDAASGWMVVLEGLENALRPKGWHDTFAAAHDRLKQWVGYNLRGLVYGKLEKVLPEIEFLISTRLLAIHQLVGSPPDQASEKLTDGTDLGTVVPRFWLSASGGHREMNLQHLQEHDPFVALHWLMNDLYVSAGKEGLDAFNDVWQRWDATLQKLERNVPWFKLVRKNGGGVGDDKNDTGKDQYFDVLNFLIACVPMEKQHALFETHSHVLKECCLPEDGRFLPNPDELNINGLLGVEKDGEWEVKAHLLSVNEGVSPLVERVNIPFNKQHWEAAPQVKERNIPFHLFNSDLGERARLLPEYVRPQDPRSLGDLIQVYNAIIKSLEKQKPGAVHFSAWNVLIEDQSQAGIACSILAWVKTEDDTSEKYASAYERMERAGLRTKKVHRDYAHFWQAGLVLADVLGYSRDLSVSSESIHDYAADTDYIDEMIRRSLFQVLSGVYWWSRPLPHALQQSGDSTGYPAVVEHALEVAEEYDSHRSTATGGTQDAGVLHLFHFNVIRYLARDMYNGNGEDQGSDRGLAQHVLAAMPAHVISAEEAQLDVLERTLERFTQGVPPFSAIRDAPVRAWLCVGARFALLEVGAATPKVRDLALVLVGACLLRAIMLFLRLRVTQLMTGNTDVAARLQVRQAPDFLNYLFGGTVFIHERVAGKGCPLDWDGLVERLERSSVQSLSAITPAGWLALFIQATQCESLLNPESKSAVRKIYKMVCLVSPVTDPWDCARKTVGIVFDDDKPSTPVARCEQVGALLQRLNAESRAQLGEGGFDWPTTEEFADEHFQLSPRDQTRTRVMARGRVDEQILTQAVLAEHLFKEDAASQEKEVLGTKTTARVWCESRMDERLCGVGYISIGLARLSGIRNVAAEREGITDSEEPQEEVTESGSITDAPSTTTRDRAERDKPLRMQDQGAPSPPIKERTADLTRLFRAQQESWMKRGRREGRHVRVALLQVDFGEFGDTYHSPLVEADIGGKHGEAIPVLLERTQEASHLEGRRRRVLRKVLDTCKYFGVDILVLPEYSVRPETVLWLAKGLRDLNAPVNLAIWAGTYRLPAGWDPGDSVLPPGFHESPRDLQSVLTLLSKSTPKASTNPQQVCAQQRGKKYPSVAAGEFFRPDIGLLKPLAKTFRESVEDTSLPIRPMDFVIELICSETFFISNPANVPAATRSLVELMSRFGMDPLDVTTEIEVHVQNDMDEVARATSMVPVFRRGITEDQVFEDFPRRSILVVPACTTRVQDFHLLGQTFHMASGGCVIFCNLAHEQLSAGGSCIVGHMSWKSTVGAFPERAKNSDKEPALTKDEIMALPARISPYHGFLPGIYLGQNHPAARPLGKNEEAIVIADIDPVHLAEGKPRAQMLPTPQRLVAHLPILDADPPSKEKEKEHKDNLEKRREGLAKQLQSLQALIVSMERAADRPASTLGLDSEQTVETRKILDELAKSNCHASKDLLELRAEFFRLFAHQQPHEWPCPALLDWILIEEDPYFSSAEIHVPPLAPPRNLDRK